MNDKRRISIVEQILGDPAGKLTEAVTNMAMEGKPLEDARQFYEDFASGLHACAEELSISWNLLEADYNWIRLQGLAMRELVAQGYDKADLTKIGQGFEVARAFIRSVAVEKAPNVYDVPDERLAEVQAKVLEIFRNNLDAAGVRPVNAKAA